MAEHAIDVRNLALSYRMVQSFSMKKNLLGFRKSETKYVHALNDVSFSVNKGEVLGVIGRNGSGKSTLLRTIAGIFAPDSGSIDLHGNSASLLALGTGFQPEISGRENIILNGMLLGFTEAEIRGRMDSIIEFSELGSFIDMPVRSFSSGMNSKLAFSITAMLEPDIILVDEILSVGDTHFRKKSYAKMRSLISDSNRTVLFVSHSCGTVKSLCDRVLWLDKGEIHMIGDSLPVLQEYTAFMNNTQL